MLYKVTSTFNTLHLLPENTLNVSVRCFLQACPKVKPFYLVGKNENTRVFCKKTASSVTYMFT